MSGSPPTRRNGSTSHRFFSRFLTLDIFLAAQIFHPGGFFHPRHQSKFQAMVALPETNISPEMDGWDTFSFPFGARDYLFSGGKLAVSFRECNGHKSQEPPNTSTVLPRGSPYESQHAFVATRASSQLKVTAWFQALKTGQETMVEPTQKNSLLYWISPYHQKMMKKHIACGPLVY